MDAAVVVVVVGEDIPDKERILVAENRAVVDMVVAVAVVVGGDKVMVYADMARMVVVAVADDTAVGRSAEAAAADTTIQRHKPGERAVP